MTNYYNILGIEENATQDQIKKAFRKASRGDEDHSRNLVSV